MKAKVHVFLKPGVLDVQGKAIEGALNGLSTVQGWANVSHVRVGKVLEFDVAATTTEEAKAQVKDMCDKLLANTVIESYIVEVA